MSKQDDLAAGAEELARSKMPRAELRGRLIAIALGTLVLLGVAAWRWW
jgi:hypothetical protein